MKYNEFLQLTEALSKQGTTIRKELKTMRLNEVGVSEMTQDPLYIREDKSSLTENTDDVGEVQTKSGHWFSKWGRMKNTLNKQGKKMQEQLNKKIMEKYLPKMVQSELQIAKELNDALNSKKQPNEIKTVIANKRQQISQIQRGQIDILSKAIDGMLTNTGKRLDAKIEASKMNEKNKLDLKNYWLLLKSQIHMNILFFMQQTIATKVKEFLKDNPEAIKMYDEFDDNSLLNINANKYKEDVDKRAADLKKREQDMKSEEDDDGEENQGQSPEEKYAEGKEFEYTDPKSNKKIKVTITSVDNENKTAKFVKTDDPNKKEFERPFDKLDKSLTAVVSEEPADEKEGGEKTDDVA